MKSIRLILLLLLFVSINLATQAKEQKDIVASPEQITKLIEQHAEAFACDSVFFYSEQFSKVYSQKDSFLVKVLISVLSCQNTLEQYEAALSTAQSLEEVLRETNESAYSYFCLHRGKSKSYMALDHLEEALSELEQCLEYASEVEEAKKAECKSLVYVDMGLLYHTKFGEIRKALEQMQKAVPFTQQILNNAPSNKSARNHFMVLNNIVVEYNILEVFDSASYYFVQSEDLFEFHPDAFTEKEQCMFYHNASLLYIHQKKGKLAMDAALKAVALTDDIEDINILFVSWGALAESYLLVGKVEEAIALSDQLITYGEQIKDANYREDYYYLMARIFKDHLPKKSNQYFFKVIELKDSIAENTLNSDLKVLEAKYEFDLERKDLEYQQLLDDRRIKNQRFYMGLLSLLLLVAVLTGYILWKNKKRVDQLILQLKEREAKLSLTNHRLERFVHSISHDMLNKLEYIVLMGNNLVEKQAIPTGFQKYYRESRDTAIWLKDYSRDLLDWSGQKIEAEKVQTNLQQLMEEILVGYEYELEEAGFDLEVDQQLPTLRMAEPPLKVVLQNLIGNAIKYSKHQAQPKLKIMATVGNGDWTIMVKDSGKGISDAEIKTIFERPSDEKAAHGRGLKIVNDILAEHEEQVWVDRNDWGGASFFFTVR